MRFCVVGAGAIGSTIAARLAGAGHDVTVLARNQRHDALRAAGLTLRDSSGVVHADVQVRDRPDFGVQDVVFLSVKAPSLPGLLPRLQPLLGPDTIVVPTINGVPWWYFLGVAGRFAGQPVLSVDPGGALLRLVPAGNLLGCVVFLSATLRDDGVVDLTGPQRLRIGELGSEPGGVPSERARQLAATLSAAQIETTVSPCIRDDVWTKLVLNVATNPLSVVAQAPVGDLFQRAELLPLVQAVVREAMSVAFAYGARLTTDPIEMVEAGRRAGGFETSMLQDFKRSRPLEVAAIGDAVLELAAKFGLAMPTTRMLLDLVRYRGAQHAAVT